MSDSGVKKALLETIRGKLEEISILIEDKSEYVVQMEEPDCNITARLLLTFHYELIEDDISKLRRDIRDIRAQLAV